MIISGRQADSHPRIENAALASGAAGDGAVSPRSGFRSLLSELNPLQYIPVIGTIYRAVTGDTIPAAAQEAGSMLFSLAIAGPIGVATDVGELLAEKMTGIEPEKIGDAMLARLGIGEAALAAGEPKAAPELRSSGQGASPWSNAELDARG